MQGMELAVAGGRSMRSIPPFVFPVAPFAIDTIPGITNGEICACKCHANRNAHQCFDSF